MLDLTGQEFGQLTVIEYVDTHKSHARWLCRCTCGQTKIISGRVLRRGASKSCGCTKGERIGQRQTTHGQSRGTLYKRYYSMRARCEDPNHMAYARYGGRGITVCERWQNFENFYADMHVGFAPGLELDRIDNDGNYEPSNVRWATPKDNTRNRAISVKLEFQGETLQLNEWAERTGIAHGTIRARLRNGWTVDRALTEPVQERRRTS